jgi:predicted nucleic-acid-binding protein
MSKRRLIDTNLIIRYLVQDHEKHAAAAARLFVGCDHGELVLVVLPEVLAECVFVLESFYEKARSETATVLSQLITSPGVEIDDQAVHVDALKRYGQTKVHFVDCVVAATAAADKVPVATFDRDFRKFKDLEIETL